MWTGLLPHEHGVIDNIYGVDDALADATTVESTVFDHLRDAGYECAYFGKWHLGEADPGLFDHYDGFNSQGGHWQSEPRAYRPETQTDACLDWLRHRSSDKPFLMVQSYYPPHNPFTAPEAFMAYYRERSVPFAGYYAAVSALDEYTGRIVAELDELGIRDDTIVVYFSDHGETFNYRRDGVHKFVCHEESIRVPFIVNGPGASGHVREVTSMVGLEDLTPTLLEWAGVAVPEHLHGRSIEPLLHGDETGAREDYYVQNRTNVTEREQRCLRTNEWKLILSSDGVNELYDLVHDPEEELDLYTTPRPDVHDQFLHLPSHDARVVELARRLEVAAQRVGDTTGQRMAEAALAEKHARDEGRDATT